MRHGPVDQLRVEEQERRSGKAPVKDCPECHSVVAAGYAICPDCGHEFPPPARKKHDAKATNAGILSGEVYLTRLITEHQRSLESVALIVGGVRCGVSFQDCVRCV